MSKTILYINDHPAPFENTEDIKIENLFTENKDKYVRLYTLAKSIEDKAESKTNPLSFIVINVHFYFNRPDAPENYPYLQNCAGIDLLKMFRLIGVKTHCVLYSPMNIKQLLQLNPGNLIITSKGVTLINSIIELEDFIFNKASVTNHFSPSLQVEKGRDEYIEKLEEADKELPKEYFKVDFTMPEEGRHDWANWWGIYKNIKLDLAFKEQKFQKNDFFSNYNLISKKLKELKSLTAIYLYDSFSNDFIVEKEDIEKYKDLQTALKERRPLPKIVFIDDRADDGWFKIFQLMIYSTLVDKEIFKKIVPTSEEINDETKIRYFYTDKIKSEIEKSDLVMLDLRLNQESGIRHDVENLSGAILLKYIRQDFPGLPVLIVTASNKSWSIEKLIQLGADAFWLKEGIDSAFTNKESVRNYLKFLDLIIKISGVEFTILKDFGKDIKKLKNIEEFSWENTNFKEININQGLSKDEQNRLKYLNDRRIHKVDRNLVFNILDETVNIIRSYLSLKITKSNYSEEFTDWFYPSLIIQHLGKIIEIIHSEDSNGPWFKDIEERGDNFGAKLFSFRNNASHYSGAKNITFIDATNFIENIIKYLENFKRGIKLNEADVSEETKNIAKKNLELYNKKLQQKKNLNKK